MKVKKYTHDFYDDVENSSAVEDLMYHAGKQRVYLKFTDGDDYYQYDNVPLDFVASVKNVQSVGREWVPNLKSTYGPATKELGNTGLDFDQIDWDESEEEAKPSIYDSYVSGDYATGTVSTAPPTTTYNVHVNTFGSPVDKLLNLKTEEPVRNNTPTFVVHFTVGQGIKTYAVPNVDNYDDAVAEFKALTDALGVENLKVKGVFVSFE